MAYIGEDLTKIKPFDFPLVLFRFTPPTENKYKREYYTTQELYLRLMKTNLLMDVLTKDLVQKRQHAMEEKKAMREPFNLEQFAAKTS